MSNIGEHGSSFNLQKQQLIGKGDSIDRYFQRRKRYEFKETSHTNFFGTIG